MARRHSMQLNKQKYQRINMGSLEDKRSPQERHAQASVKIAKFKQTLKDNW